MTARTERVQEGDGLKGEYMVRNCGCSGWSLKLWSQEQKKRGGERSSPFAGESGGLCLCACVFFQAGGVKK